MNMNFIEHVKNTIDTWLAKPEEKQKCKECNGIYTLDRFKDSEHCIVCLDKTIKN
jgi:hypothetical protein